MIKHILKLTFRNFRRHKSSFFINVIGLSTGLACSLIIVLWVNDELSIDKFHEKDERLYYVMEHQQYAGDIMTTMSTPGLLAQTLKEEVPEIEHAVTLMWPENFTLTVGEKNLKVRGHHAGADFFKMFSYPLLRGDPNQLLVDHSSAVISESLAKKLFGSVEAAFEQIFEYEHEDQFKVSGIFQDLPPNSTHQFDVLLPYSKYLAENEGWLRSWGSNSPPTIVTLVEGSNPDAVNTKISGFIKTRNEDTNVTLFLKKFSERYLYGRYENGIQAGGRIEYVKLFSVIAVFILIIACINFMNLSTARGSQRAREVGVKKTFGVHRSLLIFQYLTESMVVALASLALAIFLVLAFLPTFNLITDKQIGYNFSPGILLAFLGIAILTGILAGSYPAFYLSSFKPATVLKGELKSSLGELWARKGLVVFQFTLSVVLIVSVLIIYRQIEFVQSKNLGYDKDHLVHFPMDGKLAEQPDAFIARAKNLSPIINIANTSHDLVGQNNNTSGLQWEGKNPEDLILFENVSVGYDLLETIGVELVEGRFFSREYGRDSSKIIFNEEGIKVMGLTNPLGKIIRLWDQYDLEIIGVVKDFHFQSLHEPVKPLFFRFNPENTWVMMAKLKGGQEKEGITELQNLYEEFNPGFPFEHTFVDEDYAEQYAAEQRVSQLSRYFAGLAILISCLGLFGLAAFTGERRKKEIGIRKVLGASINQIVLLLTRDFTRLVLISISIGLPLAFYLINDWLSRFEYQIPMHWSYFVLAGLILLMISWITVSSQALKAALVHPTESIKDE
ncbi:MAG: FtsX-like permease family protein [Saprospiraceae bacterium]|nr:FtsX-like permease family protein [Saprospiraceae bacterium]